MLATLSSTRVEYIAGAKKIELGYVPTTYLMVDVMTNVLPWEKHKRFVGGWGHIAWLRVWTMLWAGTAAPLVQESLVTCGILLVVEIYCHNNNIDVCNSPSSTEESKSM